MEQGWIKLHRTIINHWIWQDSLKLKWWIDLLLMANHKENKLILGNEVIEISRGSVHTSVTKLAARWKADKKTVRKFLKLLETESMVSYSTSSKGATITICNYNDYQDFKPTEGERNLSTALPLEVAKFPQYPQTSPTVYDWKLDTPLEPVISKKEGTLKDIAKDSIRDILMDNSMDSSLDNTRDINGDNTMVNAMDNPLLNTRDITLDTNNNVNNVKNLNNTEKGIEGIEVKEAQQNENSMKSLPALSFSTQDHQKIFNSLGEVAYRTWFMDAAIEATPKAATLKVDSDFKKNIINSKFRIQLDQILGKPVEVLLR